jgi:hypothetical protein
MGERAEKVRAVSLAPAVARAYSAFDAESVLIPGGRRSVETRYWCRQAEGVMADERDRLADERDRIADERDDLANRRESAADLRENQRDQLIDAAAGRDAEAESRNRVAEHRDEVADQRAGHSGHAREDRAASAIDRGASDSDRDASAGDRAKLVAFSAVDELASQLSSDERFRAAVARDEAAEKRADVSNTMGT